MSEFIAPAATVSVIFLAGWLEGRLLSRADIACAVWSWGLVALVIWIAYPLTPIRLSCAGLALVTGAVLMRGYYKRHTR